MKPIRIGSELRIEIGYDGENGARKIVFDATKWMDELPGCTAAITAVRADGEHYIAPNVTQDEEKKTITWTLTSAETMEGEGRAQLLWMDGERIAKQAIFTTVCHESLQNDATEIEVPEPVWAQQSLAAAKAAKVSAEAAAASEEGAKAALEETKGVRDNAKTEIEKKKESAIDGINNAKVEAITSIEAEKDELAPPIICTTNGTVITMTDSADRPLRGLTVFGRTEQDGVPSEDAPVEIVSVGAAGEMTVTVLDRPPEGGTERIAIIRQPRDVTAPVGGAVTFGVLAVGRALTYQWEYMTTGTTNWKNNSMPGNDTDTLTFKAQTYHDGYKYRCLITDASGNAVRTDEVTLTIGEASGSDEADGNTQEVRFEGICLRGVPASGSAATYTDADGQGWIADTVEYDAQTGTAQIVRRVESVTFDGDAGEGWSLYAGENPYLMASLPSTKTRDQGICTHYQGAEIYSANQNTGFSTTGTTNKVYFRPADYETITVDAWRARLNASPVTVLYALAVPVVTELSGDELAAMSVLRSRYPATTVYSDAEAHMAVQYIADTKKYVDDADTEMARAVLEVDERVDTVMGKIEDVGERKDDAQKKAYENEIEIRNIKEEIIKIEPDDSTVSDANPWSSRHLLDVLCPPVSETGNPAQCYPVPGYPLGVSVSWEPVQEGEGNPSQDNVRPIVGRESVTITHSNDVQSHEYVIDLPETVYGGTVDVETGELTKTHQAFVFDGSENWSVKTHATSGITMYGLKIDESLKSYKSDVAIWQCNRLIPTPHNYVNITSPEYSISFMSSGYDVIIVLEHNSTLSVDAFKSWLAENPVQLVYKLAAPYTIQITPQQIKAISGVNTIYTDAGGLTVTAREDMQHRLETITNAIVSLGGNV